MKQGLPWYKRYPHAFIDGVQGMGPDLIGTYAVILELIYTRDGKTPRDDRHLAGLLGCSKRKAKALTDQLIEIGKISVHDGFVTNSRAETELKQSRMVREAKLSGARMGAERRWGSKENKGLDMPDAMQNGMLDKIRVDKSIKDRERAPKKDTRIPDDFPMMKDLLWASSEGVNLEAATRQAERFRDHFLGASGAKGTKRDWPATWRNWIRRKDEFNGSRNGTSYQPKNGLQNWLNAAAKVAGAEDPERSTAPGHDNRANGEGSGSIDYLPPTNGTGRCDAEDNTPSQAAFTLPRPEHD